MRRSSIISLGLTVLFSLFLTDAPADDAQDDAFSVEAKVASLIEQLANQNPQPKARGTRILRPEGYDREKDESASSARSKLYRIGPVAFPQLIEHWGDKRYHISAHNGLNGAAKILSVGGACRELVDSQLQPFGFWPAGGHWALGGRIP